MCETDNFKAGFISIIGKPNVGKSSLMNSLIGERLSIITPKPQTTRKNITGIYSEDVSSWSLSIRPDFSNRVIYSRKRCNTPLKNLSKTQILSC